MVQESAIDLINKKPKQPVKWAGGKSQLIKKYIDFFPNDFDNYVEPFVGGGAVFFYLCSERATIIDANFELINFFRVVRDDIEGLLSDLDRHRNEEEYYYQVREQDSDKMTPTERASRFLFLNKTGYNGLWRVNKKGKFNVPYGKYKKPNIKDTENLYLVHNALQNTKILCDDFEASYSYITDNTFVYLDPPYHPLSDTANFTSYTASSFDTDEQRRLANFFRCLDEIGCYVMLSNSDTEFIKNLYEGYIINEVYARRAINCKGNKRGEITELVIRNYEQKKKGR